MSTRKKYHHHNLKIWQLVTELMKNIYDLTSDFPKREDYRLTSQLTGYAVSIPSNIAEGSARTGKAFSTCLDYSLSASFKLGTQPIAALHAKYILETQFEKLNDKNNEFQRMIIGFMGKL